MLALFVARLQQDRCAQLCLILIALLILGGFFAPWLAPHNPLQINVQLKYQSSSWRYPLGTDYLGRCVLSRLIYGIRTSLFYALETMAFTLLIGIVLGLIAGYFPGYIDNILMRSCDLMLAFPDEVVILALVGLLGAGIGHIISAIIVVRWAWYTRMIRGAVRQYAHQNYVRYARIIGLSSYRILRTHILPMTLTDISVLASGHIGNVILLISSLSFLGLGVQPPTPEWGSMLNGAKIVLFSHPSQILPTAITITIVVMVFNYLGDFLRDTLEPAQRGYKHVSECHYD